MHQQAALVAAHSAYLNPMAAVQMQQMATLAPNGLIATPITPSSGKEGRDSPPHPGSSFLEGGLHPPGSKEQTPSLPGF